MGNIYFQQKKYPQAIKMYRMALDQIPDTHRDVRLRILQNVCVVYVKMGQYSDAIATYEHIMTEMKEKTDFKTGRGRGRGLPILLGPISLPDECSISELHFQEGCHSVCLNQQFFCLHFLPLDLVETWTKINKSTVMLSSNPLEMELGYLMVIGLTMVHPG